MKDPVREQYRDSAGYDARVSLHSRFGSNKTGIFRLMMDLMAATSDAHVLELGSGTGLMWTSNYDRIPPRWSITISDLSPGMLRKAHENLAAVRRSFPMVQLDAQELPFLDDYFEMIVANYMLYHVADVSRTLIEIRRLLRPGGKLFAATFGSLHMRELDQTTESVVGASLRHGDVRFGLENGYAAMARVFSEVEVFRYPDQLVVTEAQPLLDYLKSFTPGFQITDLQSIALKAIFESEIVCRSAFRITTDHGVLVASA